MTSAGTLSPMDTFSSELGTDFRITHEGRHVVPKSNFLALNLIAGPTGHSFNAGLLHELSYSVTQYIVY